MSRFTDAVSARLRTVPRAAWTKLAVFAVLFGVGVIVVLTLGVPSVAQARAWVSGIGPLAPVVFIVIFAVLTVTPFPKSVLSVAGGALWGIWPGLAICMAAVLLGGTFSFFLGRHLLSDSVRPLVGEHMVDIDHAVQRSFLAVLAIRAMPVLPFTLLNYAFGITALRYRVFALVTLIGSMPGTGVYVVVGSTGADVSSWQFWAAVGAIALLTLAGIIVAYRRRKARRVAPIDPDAAAERGDAAGEPASQ